MNRGSNYLIPPTAALALVAGGLILWSRRKSLIRQWSTTSRFKSGQVDEEADEDTLLLRQYNWRAYTNAPTPVRAVFEATLLEEILSNLGVRLDRGEASKLLFTDAGLRSNLWNAGRPAPLIYSAVMTTLSLMDTSRCQKEDSGITPRRSNLECGGLNPSPILATAVKDERDDAVNARGEEEREREDQGVTRDGAVIQRGNWQGETTQSQYAEGVNFATMEEAPAIQSHLDAQRQSETPGVIAGSRGVEIYGGIFNDVAGDQIVYSSDHRRKVAEWYSSTDYRLTHHDISKKRTENTGTWIFASEPFKRWQTDPSCPVLWCPGIPGVGKTTIASLVIDYLRQRRSGTVAVGFAYFNYKLQGQQNTAMVVECLSRQLYESYPGKGTSSHLEAFHEANQKDHPRPPTTGLHSTLSKTCHQFQQYYIVLDALDEYLENYNIENLRELLYILTSLGNTVKLLVTSRMLDGMEELFREFNAIRQEIDANDEDMSIYIRNRIGTAKFHFDISDEFLAEIVQKVKEAAGGRFLMAELHMNTLADQLNRGTLKDALANLPHEIDVTYERVLQRFKTYPESRRELAMMTLTWVTRAKRRLSVRELQHALATKAGLENIEDYVTSMSTITSLCAGLVILRDESVIFVHFTAQDFFETPRIQSEYFPGAEESIVNTCIAYLSLPLCIGTLQDSSWRLTSHIIPFYDYAAWNVGFHGGGEETSSNFNIFLTNGDIAPHLCCTHILSSFDPYDPDSPPTTTISPVLLAIYYNRITLLPSLLGPLEEVPLTAEGRTPLMYAAYMGRVACLEAMQRWSRTQHDATSPGLLSDRWEVQGSLPVGHVNGRDREGFTALVHACRQGHEEGAVLLLNYEDIDMNLVDNQGRTPLSHAAGGGLGAVVASLLNHEGIDVNLAASDGWTPLMWAAFGDHEAAVALLLAHEGIDVNLADNKGRTPLSHAAGGGREAVVAFFLNHEGIDANLGDPDGWTPLIWAARNGHEGVVRLLLNYEDIDINSADIHGTTLLSHAVGGGHEAVVALLLDHERINVNLANSDGWTPLIRAAYDGHEVAVALLFAHEGIDVNLADNKGRTPLSHAVEGCHEAVVELLLNHEGISINLADIEGRTPLSRAAEEGYEGVVELPLDHKGVDVSLADVGGRTPLDHAVGGGREVVVGLLLNHKEHSRNRTDARH